MCILWLKKRFITRTESPRRRERKSPRVLFKRFSTRPGQIKMNRSPPVSLLIIEIGIAIGIGIDIVPNPVCFFVSFACFVVKKTIYSSHQAAGNARKENRRGFSSTGFQPALVRKMGTKEPLFPFLSSKSGSLSGSGSTLSLTLSAFSCLSRVSWLKKRFIPPTRPQGTPGKKTAAGSLQQVFNPPL